MKFFIINHIQKKKNKFLILTGISALILISLSIPKTGLADIVKIENPLEAESFEELVDNIINFIFIIGFAIAPIMILIAGFMFVTGGGNPEQIKTAKNIILWTVIGLVIILCAKGIIALINNILNVKEF